jgi:hypothetical protein
MSTEPELLEEDVPEEDNETEEDSDIQQDQ